MIAAELEAVLVNDATALMEFDIATFPRTKVKRDARIEQDGDGFKILIAAELPDDLSSPKRVNYRFQLVPNRWLAPRGATWLKAGLLAPNGADPDHPHRCHLYYLGDPTDAEA